MRRRKQFSEWLATYNVGGARRVDAICRVRLTALKLKAPKRPHISLNILAHPPVEARLIDAMTLLDRHNTRVFLVSFYALRHGAARWAMRSARSRICSWRAIARLWTSSGPSAMRNARTLEYALERPASSETPAPPNAWIASSMILSAIFGA